MEEKKKKQKVMATWTIAIFGAVLAVSFAVLWLLHQDAGSKMAVLGQVFKSGWPILVIDLVLCAGLYFGYSWSLNRKK